MSRASLPQRQERRKEQAKKRKEKAAARVVRRGQRATLYGKAVIADGKGNWMPASHYDRYSKDFRKGKPVGTYVVDRDRSKDETAAQRERRVFPETEAEARRRMRLSGGRGAKATSRSQSASDRARSDRAIAQGGGRTDVGTGQASTQRPASRQQSTRPRQGGTRPVQTQRPTKPTKPTKPAKDTRTTLQKEISGAKQFIEAHKNKKGAMQNAVKQARERLARLQKKQKGSDITGKLQIRKAQRNIG
jgi:hypothetical protein